MAKKPRKIPTEPDREPRAQYAALPWRRTAEGALEVLVITSRETRRWVIPKGWPIKGMKSPDSAAREAYEEAGVVGRVAKKAVGFYAYDKRLRSGRTQRVGVDVFALQVTEERDSWPEKGQRDKLWTTQAEAAALVDEPDLKRLLADFAP
jgi:8-oxo-dGTP pyrophosphatase MutT (NUDIX family)